MNNEYLERARKHIPNAQRLSVAVGMRAEELARGAKPMLKHKEEDFMNVALLEIAEGLLNVQTPAEKIEKDAVERALAEKNVEEPIVEEPIVEEPIVEEPIVEEPIVD